MMASLRRIDMKSSAKSHRRLAWLALLLVIVATVAIVAAPVWIIQPFKPQTGRGVAVSYAMRSWSPIITIAAVVVSFLIVGWLWRGTRWFGKVALVILLLPLFAVTWFARQNHFEWMFNPLAHSAYAKTAEASFVDDADMVLAVENNGEAVAYPVRLMAYHHLVQDTVGERAVVATY
jgi:fatty acid desaturase